MTTLQKAITGVSLALIAWGVLSVRSCVNRRQDEAAASQRLLRDSLQLERGKTGQLITTKASLEEDLALNKKLVKKLQTSVEVDEKKIRDITGIKQTARDTLKIKGAPVIQYVDSGKNAGGIKSVGQFFGDSAWYMAQAFIDLEHPDSSFLDLQATDSITVSTKTAKDSAGQPWLLISVQNENPHVQTRNIDAYRYKLPKEKIKRWGIGPQFGAGLPFNTPGGLRLVPYLGIGLQYNLIRF